MRRAAKIGLTVGIGLVLAGGVVASAAVMGGASWQEPPFHSVSRWIGESGGLGAESLEEMESAEYSGVRKLKVDISAGTVEIIEEGEGEVIRVGWTGESGEFYCGMERGGELKIRRRLWDHWRELGDIYGEDARIVIRVPSGYRFDSVEIEAGAGSVTAGRLEAREVELEASAGSIWVEDGKAEKLSAECRAGDIFYAGTVEESAEAECSAGSIELQIAGKKTDFNYKLESSAGSISIGGEEFGRVAGKEKIDNHASKKMKLECSAGSVNVDFDSAGQM